MNATILFLIVLLSTANAQLRPQCDRGSFFDGMKCVLCPPGTFSETRTARSCTNCTAGTYNPFEGAQVRSACRFCPDDTFGDTEGATSMEVCQRCPPGTHSAGGDGPCVSCPPGEIVSFAGCRRCPDGEISMGNECVPCPPGTTAERFTPSTNECKPCPPHHFIVSGRCQLCFRGDVYDPSQGTCLPCPQGFFSRDLNSTRCEPCRRRFFTPSSGRTGCSRCPQDFETRGRGASLCRRIGAPCPSNSIENRRGDCVSCNIGSILNRSTATCEKCPEGHVSSGGITTECTKCPGNTVPNQDECRCPPGTEMRNGRCSRCRRGTARGFVSTAYCNPCQSGFHAPRTGMTTCIACPPGRVPESESGSVRCRRCPAGTESDLRRVPRCLVPITGCPPGFTRRADRCIVSECPEGTFRFRNRECRSCPPGSRLAGGARCRPCPQRAVSRGGVVTRCERCPNGFVQDVFDRTKCVCEGISARGFELVNGRCRECGPGMFNDGRGSGPPKCIPCPEGTVPFTGRFECSFCLGDDTVPRNGSCVRCPEGTFSYSRGDTLCHPLPE